MNIAIISTFPNNCWDVYAKQAMQSWAKHLPQEIPVMVSLDDDALGAELKATLRPQDAISCGWTKEHKEFVERNKGKDHPTDYRKQAVRFCHKVFAIKQALDAVSQSKAAGETVPRYLIWIDADVVINRPVTMDEIRQCLPKDGDAVAYLGRKDWDHSECGWLAFDLDNSAELVIANAVNTYVSDAIFNLEQWHDSWVFDRLHAQFNGNQAGAWTNLTADKPGMDIWPHSPMGKWSTHYKGPSAKQKMFQEQAPQRPTGQQQVIIQTKNAIPHEEIREHIRTNQLLIKDWIKPCEKTDEEIVIVSAGPMLVAEDVRDEAAAGRRIVAVKHALEPLKKAGIKPWMCILLDPREHVADFVKDPDKDVLWVVASQVNPEVTRRLLEAGCKIWGYHAAVGAGEEELTKKQDYAVIAGGSATATRGMYMLKHLGFTRFRLYGYDLSYPDTPKDMNEKDKYNQPKYLNVSVGYNHPHYDMKKAFWSEPQLIAQFEEINQMIRSNEFEIKAFGDGIIPFLIKAKETGELRERELKAKIPEVEKTTIDQLFEWKTTPLSTKRRRKLLPTLPRLMRKSS